MRRRCSAALLVGLLVAVGAGAGAVAAGAPAPASLDSSFGSRGQAALGHGYQLFGVAAQADGKIVVAGVQQLRLGVRLAVAG